MNEASYKPWWKEQNWTTRVDGRPYISSEQIVNRHRWFDYSIVEEWAEQLIDDGRLKRSDVVRQGDTVMLSPRAYLKTCQGLEDDESSTVWDHVVDELLAGELP
jgi:hypothetical protein